jgi:bisphosphoglycerate-dependent phosphoglycerate mutase
MPSILDTIREQVNALSADQVKAELAKIADQKAKQKERMKGRTHGPLSEEQKAKRAEYHQRPDVKAKMKEYHAKPEVKARMKEYHKTRNEKTKAILARAKELGIELPTAAAA